jgi:hypothetical protein
MRKRTTILYLLMASILSTGCSSKKKCVGENVHKGLFNALTCDYDSNIQELEVSLNSKTIERNQLFHNYQRLIAKTTNKQANINQLDQEIIAIDESILSIEGLVNNMKESKSNALNVLKLKSRLKKLNMNILNKSTFFDIDDALFTNKKLLVSSDKQVYAKAYTKDLLEDKKYARAYSKDLLKDTKYVNAYDKNLLKEQKYAQAYNKDLLKDKKYAQAYQKNLNKTFAKAYQKEIEQDKKLRHSLSAQIETISNSLNSNNLSASQASINNLIEKIKNYNNSSKKS